MPKPLNLTDEQRAEAARRIEHGFAFAREIMADPAILDRIPNGSEVIAIPTTERAPDRSYDIETPTMVAIVRSPALERATPHQRKPLLRRERAALPARSSMSMRRKVVRHGTVQRAVQIRSSSDTALHTWKTDTRTKPSNGKRTMKKD